MGPNTGENLARAPTELVRVQSLKPSDKAMFQAGDFQIPSMDFPYQARYEKCYTIQAKLKNTQ
jgi:hypothetical protein